MVIGSSIAPRCPGPSPASAERTRRRRSPSALSSSGSGPGRRLPPPRPSARSPPPPTGGAQPVERPAARDHLRPGDRRPLPRVVVPSLPPDLEVDVEHHLFGRAAFAEDAVRLAVDEPAGPVIEGGEGGLIAPRDLGEQRPQGTGDEDMAPISASRSGASAHPRLIMACGPDPFQRVLQLSEQRGDEALEG